MPPEPIRYSGAVIDLSPRVAASVTVAASPAAAAETTVATITLGGNVALALGVLLFGFVAFTVGTAGATARLRIRQTNTSGTVVADTGATTGGIAAAALVDMNVGGFDAAATLPGQVYVLTLQVGSATAGSAVSNVQLAALAI